MILENIHPPTHRKDWNFLRGICKTKTFKEIYEAYLEFPKGGHHIKEIQANTG